MLGMNSPRQPLVALAGGRQMVRELMPPGYKPAESGRSTNVLAQAIIKLEELPPDNVAEKDNIRLVVVGKITQPLEGCACPMGVLGREFLGKLKLSDDEIVLADMEAGIEHFGRGLETGLDTVLIIVEPSFESISLAERIRTLANNMGIERVWAILNKVNSKAITSRLSAELQERGVIVIGAVPYDKDVFGACLEGRSLSAKKGGTGEALHNIVNYLLDPSDIRLHN